MGQLLIRNLDDAVIAALKRRAAEHRTSAEEEARRALTAGVGLGVTEWLAKADAFRGKIGPVSGPTSLDDLRASRARDEVR